MKKYYLLANGVKVDAAEVIAVTQGEEYYQLHFNYGSSLEQKGKVELVEEEVEK